MNSIKRPHIMCRLGSVVEDAEGKVQGKEREEVIGGENEEREKVG
jgi:hypothetical protein